MKNSPRLIHFAFISALALILSFWGPTAHGKLTLQELNQIEETINTFYRSHAKSPASQPAETGAEQNTNLDPHCPVESECLKIACKRMDPYECLNKENMQKIRQSCEGVLTEACLRGSLSYLTAYEHNHVEEMSRLIQSCRGLKRPRCLDYTCQTLTKPQCDNLEEIIRINKKCAESDQKLNLSLL